MPATDGLTETTILSSSHNDYSTITLVAAAVCLVWYVAVALVCTVGHVQIFRHYSRPQPYESPTDLGAGPHVTIIRPVKGLEPYLYDCLASTFRQRYPAVRLHIRLCVPTRDDPAVPVLERLVRDFPHHDARILVEEEDEELRSGRLVLGPNPKIRNMSRAYREIAEHNWRDLVWIIDCNVWIGRHTLGRMLRAFSGHKFVHQLPLVVDTLGTTTAEETGGNDVTSIRTTSNDKQDTNPLARRDRSWWTTGGGRLEEMFTSTSHAKFYTAINTVAIAPCIVGKSTLFKSSHLNSLTDGKGIDSFSYNICEDHLIGDLLWKGAVPDEAGYTWDRWSQSWEMSTKKLGNHALCFGDLAIQPMAQMSVADYWRRRVRWLRVRKFTVTLATLVEPGTEAFLCSAYGAFAVTTLPYFNARLGIPTTWTAFSLFWLLSVSIWCAMDWTLYQRLHSGASVHEGGDMHIPDFVAGGGRGGRRRGFGEWLVAWLGRETLALPIWVWAFWGGTTVEWRGRKFWVGVDMKVHEIKDEGTKNRDRGVNGHITAIANEKARKE
ncbi:Ceramide glucosyltransferase [Vermiconidia calcicola]|uniref:Ceramide glucosyltransferase n=1 Tax=Vermiconidia calcicola TaxID=1690605 RepID=A0ACC3N0G1_9PEZI|nr:Ceramide glucosyltransferase [Vermiconidia calcicola]